MIDLVIEQHLTAAETDRITGINERTAQRLVKAWKDSGSDELPPRKEPAKQKGPKATLTEEHTQFLINYIDETMLYVHSSRDRRSARQPLIQACEEIGGQMGIPSRSDKLGRSGLNTDLDYFTNCVFIDEAGSLCALKWLKTFE